MSTLPYATRISMSPAERLQMMHLKRMWTAYANCLELDELSLAAGISWALLDIINGACPISPYLPNGKRRTLDS